MFKPYKLFLIFLILFPLNLNAVNRAEDEAYSLLNELFAETDSPSQNHSTPKTTYLSLNDSTLVISYDMILTDNSGNRKVEPVECLYSITPTATLAAFNFINSNGFSILDLAQQFYEQRIGDLRENQTEEEFKDEIFWFVIMSHLTEHGHKLK